jgi:hypothetical protein
MALPDTLDRASFMNILPIANQTMWLPDQSEYNRTGGGEQLGADRGERLWQGEIEIGRLRRSEAGLIETRLDLLNQAGRAFHVYDSRRPNPFSDPNLAVLGGIFPTIFSLEADPRDLRLAGLPAGYVLTAGDYLSFLYASTRMALHRVVPSTVVAAGDGTTPVFEVAPAIKPGATTGTAVRLSQAFCKAVIVAGSVQPTRTRSTISEGLRFAYVQTVR